VRIEKIIVTVLHEAHARQVEEVMYTLQKVPEKIYGWAGFFPPQPFPLARRNGSRSSRAKGYIRA
jgi:hypothetical protein